MTGPSYNGWTNYETWCVALWLDNDESTYNYVRELAAENAGLRQVSELADAIQAFVDEMTPERCSFGGLGRSVAPQSLRTRTERQRPATRTGLFVFED